MLYYTQPITNRGRRLPFDLKPTNDGAYRKAGTVPSEDGANSLRTEGSKPDSCIRDFAADSATVGISELV